MSGFLRRYIHITGFFDSDGRLDFGSLPTIKRFRPGAMVVAMVTAVVTAVATGTIDVMQRAGAAIEGFVFAIRDLLVAFVSLQFSLLPGVRATFVGAGTEAAEFGGLAFAVAILEIAIVAYILAWGVDELVE